VVRQRDDDRTDHGLEHGEHLRPGGREGGGRGRRGVVPCTHGGAEPGAVQVCCAWGA
jgi:hypothetical protein